MGKEKFSSKKELFSEIERTWKALNLVLDRPNVPLISSQDAKGWGIKDHIIHLMRWERSVVFFLQGKPRHQGLGVEENTYLNNSEDNINEEIHKQTKDLPFDIALAQCRETHKHLLDLLEPLTDSDLQKRYRDFLPDEPGKGDGPAAIDVIYGNTANHYTEHLEWIEALMIKSG